MIPTNLRYRVVIVLLSSLAFASLASAQKPTPTPERNREIFALLNDARYAAPELAVDTFLKVVETKKVTDAVWRKEIIEEALRMIEDVQHAIPMRLAYGKQNELNDTEASILAGAFFAKLDRLSFKGRVIKLLLETEPARAKQMVFQMGGDFGLKPRTCEDIMTYWVNGIYPVVGKVAAASFTEKQVAEGQRALFVAPWIENIESPSQIPAAFELVQQLQGSPAERQLLYSALAKSMNRDFKDDRSFTNSLLWGNVAARVGKLTDDALRVDIISSYRSMLLKNLRGSRCTDNEIKKGKPLPDYIEGANKLMAERPLAYEDVAASELKGTVKVKHLLTPATTKLRDELIAVRDTKVVDNKLVNHDVTDAAWVSRVNEFIEKILALEATDGETESEMFFLKTAFLGGMLSGVSPGELHDSIVRKYLRQLVGSSLQKSNFIVWRAWIGETERMAPDRFYELVLEFPNPNLKVMASANKLLAEPKAESKKESPKATPTPAPAVKP